MRIVPERLDDGSRDLPCQVWGRLIVSRRFFLENYNEFEYLLRGK